MGGEVVGESLIHSMRIIVQKQRASEEFLAMGLAKAEQILKDGPLGAGL